MVRPLGSALCGAAALAILVAASPPASGSTPDVFGLGSASTALAGAVTASATDFSAAYYNPAGLALGGRAREASFGVTAYASRLQIRDQRVDISDPVAFEIGMRAPIPLAGVLADRLAFGLALHLLPSQVVHVVAHTPEEAFFPYYDNRTQRLLVLPAIAGRLTRTLALGLGFDILAELDGKVETDIGATRAIEPRIDEKIGALVRLHAGLRWDPHGWLSLGLCFRQGFAVPYSTKTHNRIAGEDIDIDIAAEGLFTPDELWAGAAVRPGAGLRLTLDAAWLRWSAWRGPYVAVSSVLPIAGPFDVTPPALKYRDIFTVRAGAEWQLAERRAADLVLRLGGGYEPSPLPDQPGVTNLLDGSKVILAAGLGTVLRRVLPEPVRIDAHVMAHFVADRTYTKIVYKASSRTCPGSNQVCGLHDEIRDNASDPTTLGTQISNIGYPSIAGGGTVWEGGATVTLSL